MANIKQFDKLFDQLSRQDDTYKLFDGFLDYFLEFFNFEGKDENVEKIFQRFRIKELPDIFRQLFEEVHHLVKDRKDRVTDPLGDFYEQRLANARLGQFFTPNGLCEALAQAVGLSDKPEEFGKIVVDPACGSGRILLHAAQISKNYLFFAGDVSPICYKMTTLNFLINALVGEISHLNFITNEFHGVNITFFKEKENLLIPTFIHSTDPNKSLLHQSLKQIQTHDHLEVQKR